MNTTIHNIESSAILEIINLQNLEDDNSIIEGKILAEFINEHIPLNTFCEALGHMSKLCPNSVDAMRESLL